MNASKKLAVLEALDRTEAARPEPTLARSTSAKAKAASGLKHIGGYLEKEDVATFALLKAWLELDNSSLIKRAIDDLYTREETKRRFGD